MVKGIEVLECLHPKIKCEHRNNSFEDQLGFPLCWLGEKDKRRKACEKEVKEVKKKKTKKVKETKEVKPEPVEEVEEKEECIKPEKMFSVEGIAVIAQIIFWYFVIFHWAGS